MQDGVPRDFLPWLEWGKWHYQKQLDFRRSVVDNWESIFLAGNGSGKTHIIYWITTGLLLGLYAQQDKMDMMPPLSIKVLVTDFEHGLDTIASDALFSSTYMPDGTTIGPMMPASMVEKKWSKEDKTLYLKNGSKLWWMTSEQKRDLHKGSNMDVLICDEEPKKPQYDESVRGLRNAKGKLRPKGKILWGFTPPIEEGKPPSWSKFHKFDMWKAGQLPHCNFVNAHAIENPAITEEFMDEFTRGKTPEEIAAISRGEYPIWGKLVPPYFEDSFWDAESTTGNLLPSDWEVPFHDDRCTFEFALDWHDTKPAAAVWTCETADGDIVVYDELAPEVAKNKTILELAQVIQDIEGQKFGINKGLKIRRIGDPKMKDKSNAQILGFNSWQQFRNCGIYLAEGWNREPGVGYSVVNDYIRGNRTDHPRLFVLSHLRNTRLAMSNHFWTDDGKPDPKWSDYPYCVRQVVQRKARKSKSKIMRLPSKWPLTSYGGDPRYGPYGGLYARRASTRRNIKIF